MTTTSLDATASRIARSSAAWSSGTMPRRSGSPPASRTSAASAGAVASRTWPTSSVAVDGSTTSSPVETIATRGRAWTRTSVTPADASSPRSWARSGRPAPSSSPPARASSSARTTPSPGATGRMTSIVPGIASCVYSTMTTASAPSGIMPPVGIAIAPPGGPRDRGARPISTAPMTSSGLGSPSEAPYVSAARTAKPSTVERAKPGRSCGATTGSAGTRPWASASATVSTGVRRPGRKPASTSATVRTAKNSLWVAGPVTRAATSRCPRGPSGGRAPRCRRGPCRAR